MADGDSGVSNLERSAFWIYGVTAMIMREPLGTVLRHAWAVGLSDWQARTEILRVFVVLVLVSRLFLAAGLHFEIVFMRPGAGKLYPKRNYPIDFLAGMIQLLIAVAAATTVSLHDANPDAIPLFDFVAAAVLFSDVLWLAVAALLGFSALRLIATRAGTGAAIAIFTLIVGLAARTLGAGPIAADFLALVALLLLSSLDLALLIRRFGAAS